MMPSVIQKNKTIFTGLLFLFGAYHLQAQTDSLLTLLPQEKPQREYITGAFKSSRVINNQSVEMIGKGVLDMRVLHRFGALNSGFSNFFGLDQASFRLGFDYGITNHLTVGIGRSTFRKEFDGLLKWRVLQQSRGPGASPVSVLLTGGITVNTTPVAAGEDKRSVSDRTGYYYQVIVGRKFNDVLSMQFNPTGVHRNRITPGSDKDQNEVFALGAGMRLRVTRRISFVADYDYIIYGLDKSQYKNPLGLGIDIETGGHVFQLHFSNSQGLNENAFLTQTIRSWGKGEVSFGFNLSRVFNVKKKKLG